MSKKEYVDKESLFELIYPIGSIYLSVASVDPTDLFGFDTWKKIEDTFLLASGAYAPLGSIGGSENHTLTIAEMPSHTHMSAFQEDNSPTNTITANAFTKDSFEINTKNYRSTNNRSVLDTGEGQPFSIMPPYLSINIWKRMR